VCFQNVKFFNHFFEILRYKNSLDTVVSLRFCILSSGSWSQASVVLWTRLDASNAKCVALASILWL